MSKCEIKRNIHTQGGRAKEWDTAITDAEDLISDYKDRIDRLNRAITRFTAMRNRGESFPRLRKKKGTNKAAEAAI